jgi:hypothetical protein
MDLRHLTDTFDKWITLVYSSKLEIIYKGMANYEKHCIYFVELSENFVYRQKLTEHRLTSIK